MTAFYAIFFQRTNLLKQLFQSVFLGLCSWPRLIMEVFLRNKMGERYFSLTSVVFVLVLMDQLATRIPHRYGDEKFIGPFTLWYVFEVAFLLAGIYRKWELWQPTHEFDAERFSMSTGDSWPWLTTIRFMSRDRPLVIPTRLVETLIEPAVFFVPGLLLWVVGQQVGLLFMGCAVLYSLSYVASYQQGRNFLLDQIDQHICQQDLGSTMREGYAPEFARGVKFPGELPTDPEKRQQLASAFLDEETAYPIR